MEDEPGGYSPVDVGLVDEGTFTLTVQDSECGIEVRDPLGLKMGGNKSSP